MKQNTFIGLITLILIGAGLSYWLNAQKPDVTLASGLLFEDLATQGQQITAINIANHEGPLLQASLVDGNWQALHLAEGSQYPLDASQLAELIKDLSQAKLLEAKTAKTEYHSKLGLSDLNSEDSQARMIEVTGSKEWQLLVGNLASSGNGDYVRKPDDNQTWLLDRSLSLPGDAYSWLQQPILAVEPASIDRIDIQDATPWSIIRDQELGLQLVPMPKGRALQFDGVLDTMVRGIANLNFERLTAWDEGIWSTYELVKTLTVSLNNGDQISLKLAKFEETYFVSLVSETTPGYWQNWIYQVSSYSAGQLNKSLEDLLAEPVSEEPQTPALDEGESPQD